MGVGPTYIICTSLLAVFLIAYSLWVIRSLQHTINSQNDTIQRLINREPVTYQETGQKPPKVIEEVYSAWGNVTVDREVTQE